MKTTGNTDDVQDALTNFIKYIDPKYKTLTMDKDGDWRVHQRPPHILGGKTWWYSDGDEAGLSGLTLPYDEFWKDSLINLEEVRGNE